MRLPYALFLAFVTVAVHASAASAQPGPARPTMQVEPPSGGPGTVIDVRSVDPCPLAETGEAVRVHAMLLQHESPVLDETDGPVGEDGHWIVELVVPDPSKLHSEGLAVTARCYLPGPAPIEWYYEHGGFAYTGPTWSGQEPAPASDDAVGQPAPTPQGSLPETGGLVPAFIGASLLSLGLATRRLAAVARRQR